MNYIDQLNNALRVQLQAPWSQDQSGGERVWFLVFDPEMLRKVMARRDLFQLTAQAAQKTWVEIDISNEFGEWMASHRYAESFYKRPGRAKALPQDFAQHLADRLRHRIDELDTDENTLLVLSGTEALFGINKISQITSLIENKIKGRLLVFFPGEYSEPHYRFLDARDGWNYLAIPVTAADGR